MSSIGTGAAKSMSLSTTIPNVVPSIATRTVYLPGAYARVVGRAVDRHARELRAPGGTSN